MSCKNAGNENQSHPNKKALVNLGGSKRIYKDYHGQGHEGPAQHLANPIIFNSTW